MSTPTTHVAGMIQMPTEESAEALAIYLDAATAAGSTEFPGMVLMALMFYMPDPEVWKEATCDALNTLAAKGGVA